MGVVADLEAIGDDVARHQAVAGRWCPLRERVGHRRRADDQALSAPFGEDVDQQVGDDLAHPVVAAVGIGIGAGDRHHRRSPGGLVRLESCRPEFHPGLLPEGAAVLRHEASALCGDCLGVAVRCRPGGSLCHALPPRPSWKP